MKKLRILFTAVIITCFASLFCGCKEPDEQGLKHIEVDLILFEEPDGKYELTLEYNGESYSFKYDIAETEITFPECVRMREYEYYKDVLSEEEYNANYTFLETADFFLETRKNVELKISYTQEINDVLTKYSSTIVIPYVEEHGYIPQRYSGKESITFTDENGKTIDGYLVYEMMRS